MRRKQTRCVERYYRKSTSTELIFVILGQGTMLLHQENGKLTIMGNYLKLPVIRCKLFSLDSLTATLILRVNSHNYGEIQPHYSELIRPTSAYSHRLSRFMATNQTIFLLQLYIHTGYICMVYMYSLILRNTAIVRGGAACWTEYATIEALYRLSNSVC